MRGISDTAKKLAERSSRKQAQELLDTIARGGTRATKTPKVAPAGVREDISRLMILLGLEDPSGQ
jgi:hypothetical protein